MRYNYPKHKKLIFREDFTNPLYIASNKGIITGAGAVLSNGSLYLPTNTNYIRFIGGSAVNSLPNLKTDEFTVVINANIASVPPSDRQALWCYNVAGTSFGHFISIGRNYPATGDISIYGVSYPGGSGAPDPRNIGFSKINQLALVYKASAVTAYINGAKGLLSYGLGTVSYFGGGTGVKTQIGGTTGAATGDCPITIYGVRHYSYALSLQELNQLYKEDIYNKYYSASKYTDISGLVMDFDASNAVITSGKVSSVPDASGNGHSCSQATAGNRPVVTTTIDFNGKPAIRFTSANSERLQLDLALSGYTGGHIFMVMKNVADPSTGTGNNYGGVYVFGSDSSPTAMPYTDGVFYDGFASTARKTTVNPTINTTNQCLYEAGSAASSWTNYINSQQQYFTATNTVGWAGTQYIGYGGVSGVPLYFDGWIAKLLVYSRKLDEGEATIVRYDLAKTYGIDLW